jgi:hypothetical protein
MRKLYLGAKRRKNIVLELLDTERRYLQQLQIVIEKFRKPLVDRSKTRDQCILPAGVIDAIFINVADVAAGVAVLEAELTREVKGATNWVTGPAIGRAFLHTVSSLVPHIDYTCQFNDAFDAYQQVMRMPTFSAWSRVAAKAIPELAGLDLHDLLILPVQRPMRYIMLTDQIIANSSPVHPDYADLIAAHACLRRLASFMNERRRKRDTMLQARKDIIGIDDLARDPLRYLVRKGPLMHSDHKSRREEYCFLFNDVLVLAKAVPREKDKDKDKAAPVPATATPPIVATFKAVGRIGFEGDMRVEVKAEPKGNMYSFYVITPD